LPASSRSGIDQDDSEDPIEWTTNLSVRGRVDASRRPAAGGRRENHAVPIAARLVLSVLLALALPACAGWLRQAGPETCRPSFPYQDGWLGGDAAYSVPLSATESLWLFGDTFVAAQEQQDRVGSKFIHNSIAVSRCDAGRWGIRYFWSTGPDGHPVAFLKRHSADAWWWLFDGFLHEGRLYIGLLEVESSPPRGPLALPFRFTGMQLARVENPKADPASWRIRFLSLSSSAAILPGSAMVLDGEHLYLFTFLDRGDGRFPRGLARLPLTALEGDAAEPASALEYLAGDGRWKPGLDHEDARLLMTDNATEMSVRYRSDLGVWLALYSYPDRGEQYGTAVPSDGVYVRTAEGLAGPWSEPRLLFRVPELDPDYVGGYDPDSACYAAKEHSQFSRPGGITFTYVCNLFTPPGEDPWEILRRLLVAMNLYRPNAVSVPLPWELRFPPPRSVPKLDRLPSATISRP
jgi:hypothetical protein